MDGKRLRAVVFSVVGTIGVLASVLAVDQPDGPSGWVLLLVGSVAAGVLCGLAAVGPEAPAQDDAGTPGRPAAEPATDAATSQSGRPAGGAPQTTAAPGRQALRRLTQATTPGADRDSGARGGGVGGRRRPHAGGPDLALRLPTAGRATGAHLT